MRTSPLATTTAVSPIYVCLREPVRIALASAIAAIGH